jgi:cytochrome c oxidase assembly protein subunit 15
MNQAGVSLLSPRRLVRLWLLVVAALVFITLLVGGATRLTESGLSIVEWKPLTGVTPPLSDGAWQTEFEKYKSTPQYQQLNRGMSLDEFKTIYWWEWTHRLLGRIIGAAFLLPFFWFLWRGWIDRKLQVLLWTIFGLGALQGAVGWWMVASGLTGRVSVSQYRLAFHLTLACVIYAALVWTAQRLMPPPSTPMPRRLRMTARVLLILVLVQIYFGALVAGLDAGLVYNTFPLIDGAFVPDTVRLFFEQPLWKNFFENTLMVQFQHRMLAYAIVLIAIAHLFDVAATTRGGRVLATARRLAVVVVVQVSIGVYTLIQQAPISLSLLHQAMAIVLLTIAVVHAERITAAPAVAASE